MCGAYQMVGVLCWGSTNTVFPTIPILFLRKKFWQRGLCYLLHNVNYKTCDFLFPLFSGVFIFVCIFKLNKIEAIFRAVTLGKFALC
jgi:hypothetical protein